MSADSITDIKPPASEVTKPKTEIKNKPSPSSEHKSTTSEQLSALRKKIENIFTRRESSNQPPSQTLKELAATEIPQDTQKQAEPTTDQTPENNPSSPQETSPVKNSQPEKSPEPKPIIPDTTQQDQAEITQLTQAIQDLKEEPTPQNTETTPETPPPQLFPDRPSLYEQHHQAYDREKRTIIGALERSAHIRQLKKEGIKDNTKKIYDQLRSRGFSGHSIIWGLHDSSKEKHIYGHKPMTSEEINQVWLETPKIIDRLYSVNYYYDSYQPDFDFLSRQKQILSLTDQRFQEKRQQIQPLFFLDISSTLKFLSNETNDPKIDTFITYLTSDFLNGQNNSKDSFNSIQYSVGNILTPTTYNNYNNEFDNFIRLAISSDLNPGQPIKIPEELIPQQARDLFNNEKGVVLLTSLPDRQQQRFLIENYQKNHSSYTHDRGGRAFFKDGIPTIEFYREFLFSTENQGKKITIPAKTLALTNDPNKRAFYQNVSNLDNPEFQKVCFFNGSDPYAQYFSETGQPNVNLFINYYRNNKTRIFNGELPHISDEQCSKLSPEDQSKLKITEYIFSLDQKLGMTENSLSYFLSDSTYPLEAFFDSNNQPNSLFFKTIFGNYRGLLLNEDQTQYILDIISEKIKTFSDDEKALWNNILSLQDINNNILNFIFKKRDSDLTTPSYFNSDGTPKVDLFKDLINNDTILTPGFLPKNLTPNVIANFNEDTQPLWKCILLLKNPDQYILKTIISNSDFHQWFNQDKFPSSALLMDLSAGNLLTPDFFYANFTPDVLESFPPEQKSFWLNILSLKFLDKNTLQYFSSSEFFNKYKEYSDKDTSLISKLLQDAISHGAPKEFIDANLTTELINSLSDSDPNKIVFPLILSIDDQDNRRIVAQNSEIIAKVFRLSPNPQETLNQYLSVFKQIENSPSKEIQKIRSQLSREIIISSNPLETYQKISNIFIKNNLPMVGKIYRVFHTIYPSEKINEMLKSNKNLSRVLISNQSPHLRQSIIFDDLLKVNLGSRETSLVNYLNLFQSSSPLLEKAKSGKPLNQNETNQLSIFFKKLNTLYDYSLLSRLQPTKTLDTFTLQSRIDQLYQKYKVAEGQTISDRVAQMYLSGLGLKSISEALNYITQTQESAHQRNLSRTNFSLAQGDLVKTISSNNLDNILNFGCVAREYLGADADSDSTPFDTDAIRADSNYTAQEISSVGLDNYGDLFIIVKNRGQFQNTTDIENPKYDPTKLEVFSSGVRGQNHYGVRTGLPSSEIDFLVATDTSPQRLANIYFQISSHGVYIPVLDPNGNILFTPKDFQEYQINPESVSQPLLETDFQPTELINSLKKVPYLKKIYEMDSGVFEGYTVEKHTQMVMGQFEKYFSKGYQSNVLNIEEFRFLLSLHDIGKGEAVSTTGSTTEQHFYTQKIAKNIFNQTGTSEKSTDIMVSLIDQDILGDYFKGNTSIELASKSISNLSDKLDIPIIDLMETLKMFYICDAGAYTSNAGGKASLDHLFQFNPEQGEASFSDDIESMYQKLIKSLPSNKTP